MAQPDHSFLLRIIKKDRGLLRSLSAAFFIIVFVELFAFKLRIQRKRLIAIHAHIDTPEHLRDLPAIGTRHLDGLRREHADPEVDDRTSDD